MEKLIKKLIQNQAAFFKWYFIVVFALIAWSYYEGVGDIHGDIHILNKPVIRFKAGYFTSLNYGIYYVFFMPLFFKTVFETYKRAYKISNLKGDEKAHDKGAHVQYAVEQYSSKVIAFLKKKYSLALFIFFILIFSLQSYLVTNRNIKQVAIGWTQGLRLKDSLPQNSPDTLTLKSSSPFFYLKKDFKLSDSLESIKELKITNLHFSVNRKTRPSNFEFYSFVYAAKLFFSLFEAFVFFFNINMLYCLVFFIMQKNKELLFQSEEFVTNVEDLITKISLSGLFLTIYLYFRYIANIQKGSFQPFNFEWDSVMFSDQYTLLFGALFIPFTAISLFIYVYFNNTVVDLKATSVKRIVSLYFPVISFLMIFFIYLLAFDPYMLSQFQFIIKPLEYVNKYLLG